MLVAQRPDTRQGALGQETRQEPKAAGNCSLTQVAMSWSYPPETQAVGTARRKRVKTLAGARLVSVYYNGFVF